MALGAYVLGSLDSREAADVYAHLAWCPFCRVEADDFLGLPALLGRVSEKDIHQAGRPPRAVLERMLKVTARRRRVTQAVITIAASVVIGMLGGSLWLFVGQGGSSTSSTSLSAPAAGAASGSPTASALAPPEELRSKADSAGPDMSSATAARELTAAKGTVHATLRLRSGQGGTELVVALGGVPAGTQCRVIVISTGGGREQAANWTVNTSQYGGEVATFSGSTAFAMDDIRRVDLVTPKGKLLLTVPAK
jgi:hypothetical protein